MLKLAVKGGSPLRTKKFPVWPQFGEKEFAALERVLKSRSWGTLGHEVQNFNNRFAQYQQAKYGISVTNGTVTLEIILRALGIGYGDEVIIPPYTFNATASAVLMNCATPVFADIERDTFNIDPESIERMITPRTKAIIPVHVGGRACNMDRIMEIAKKHKLYVIEDSAHAHGSEWDGKRVGSIGHAGSFSFQASKNLTAGEGGFITVNDDDLFERCFSIHHCGRDYKSTVWYEHVNIGTNARMTEWQAAILDAQLDRLDGQVAKRMENAAYLNSRFKEIACVESLKYDPKVTRNSYHLFIFRFIGDKCKGLSRESFINALTAEGIKCSSGYSCLYKQPLFKGDEIRRLTGTKIPYNELHLENSELATGKEGIWLTQNTLLAEKEDMDDIADAVLKIYDNVDELL